jgi:TatD DNase family protein
MYGGDEEIENVLNRARQAGIDRCVTIGSGSGWDGIRQALALAEKHKDVFATAGIHPLEATLEEEMLNQVYSVLKSGEVVACGEMGLDFFRNTISVEVQEACFLIQLEWAKEFDLPVIIHDRESSGRVFSILRASGAFDWGMVLYHCFTGTRAHMEEIVEQGGYISIPGIVTFKNAPIMKEVAKKVPLSRLLIETDAPFLTPAPHRGKRNEPSYLIHTAQYIADLRVIPLNELIKHTDRNAREIFGI